MILPSGRRLRLGPDGHRIEPAPAAPPAPTPLGSIRFASQATGLVTTLSAWASAGCPVVPDAVYAQRLAACQSCPQWRATGWFGTGSCRLCGCGRLKLRLATAQCPATPPQWPCTPPA